VAVSFIGRGNLSTRRKPPWIFNYLCNQCLSPLMLRLRISISGRCTILCNKVCQWLVAGRGFSPGPPFSSTNKIDRHWYNWNIAESDVKHHNPNSFTLCNHFVAKIFSRRISQSDWWIQIKLNYSQMCRSYERNWTKYILYIHTCDNQYWSKWLHNVKELGLWCLTSLELDSLDLQEGKLLFYYHH
jgi:hypothetical protein